AHRGADHRPARGAWRREPAVGADRAGAGGFGGSAAAPVVPPSALRPGVLHGLRREDDAGNPRGGGAAAAGRGAGRGGARGGGAGPLRRGGGPGVGRAGRGVALASASCGLHDPAVASAPWRSREWLELRSRSPTTRYTSTCTHASPWCGWESWWLLLVRSI